MLHEKYDIKHPLKNSLRFFLTSWIDTYFSLHKKSFFSLLIRRTKKKRVAKASVGPQWKDEDFSHRLCWRGNEWRRFSIPRCFIFQDLFLREGEQEEDVKKKLYRNLSSCQTREKILQTLYQNLHKVLWDFCLNIFSFKTNPELI